VALRTTLGQRRAGHPGALAQPRLFPSHRHASRGRVSGIEDAAFQSFTVEKEEYALLRAIPAAERPGVLLTVPHAWVAAQCRIQDLSDDALAVRIQGRSRHPFVVYEPDQRWWVENFRAALDADGEWFLDAAAGVLWYQPRPGEDMAAVEVVAPVAEQFVVLRGVRDVTLRGLTFHHGQYLYPAGGCHDTQAAAGIDGAIDAEDCSGLLIDRCEVAHIGRYAVFFRSGCSSSVVANCHLHDLGAGGVRVGGADWPDEARVCRDIRVDNNIIQHGGRVHPAACGVLLTHARNCTVSHNDIGDLYYTGVSAGWTWGYGESPSRDNRIENNHIHHLGWGYLSDMGGFYGLGVAPGTRVTGNHIHHVASNRYGGWGLYTDEGSTDVWMENNLVHDTSDAGFHQHYGFYNRIRNNIFAFGRKAQVHRSRPERHTCFLFERNIVVWDPESPLLDGGEYNWKLPDAPAKGEPRDPVVFRRNLYWRTDGTRPDLLARKWTWDEWRKLGRDAGSLFANPQFENLAARDFRLKPGSPAAQTGFVPWDLSRAGVRGDGPEGAAWRAKAAEGAVYPAWDTDSRPWPAPVYRIARQHFETTDLWTVGLRNASTETENKGDLICVSEEAASPLPLDGVPAPSRRSLMVQRRPRPLPQLPAHPQRRAQLEWRRGGGRIRCHGPTRGGLVHRDAHRSHGRLRHRPSGVLEQRAAHRRQGRHQRAGHHSRRRVVPPAHRHRVGLGCVQRHRHPRRRHHPRLSRSALRPRLATLPLSALERHRRKGGRLLPRQPPPGSSRPLNDRAPRGQGRLAARRTLWTRPSPSHARRTARGNLSANGSCRGCKNRAAESHCCQENDGVGRPIPDVL
jgi:hypothetical protein